MSSERATSLLESPHEDFSQYETLPRSQIRMAWDIAKGFAALYHRRSGIERLLQYGKHIEIEKA